MLQTLLQNGGGQEFIVAFAELPDINSLGAIQKSFPIARNFSDMAESQSMLKS